MEQLKYKRYLLILYNDEVHSQQHFLSAIKKILNLNNKATRILARLIEYEGSAICVKDSLERTEHYQEQFLRFGLKTSIEERLE